MDASGLSRIVAVALNTHRESVRERVLYNLVVFAILMTFSGWLIGELSVRQDQKILKDLGLAAMDGFGTIIALFIGVGLVRKEIERRSLHSLLAKPLSRGEFLVGKFIGLALTLLVNLGVMTLGLYLTLVATRHPADPRLFIAIYAIYLGLLLVVAIAMLLSTLTNSIVAMIGTLALIVAGRYSDVVRNMRADLPGAPTWLVQGLSHALPNFRNFDLKNRIVYGDPVSSGELAWITLYSALYCGAALILACEIFRRKDIV